MPTENELKQIHNATITALQRGLAGLELNPDEQQAATDMLTAMAILIGVDPYVVHKIEHRVRTIRLNQGRDTVPRAGAFHEPNLSTH